jgi:hypothetical protein
MTSRFRTIRTVTFFVEEGATVSEGEKLAEVAKGEVK